MSEDDKPGIARRFSACYDPADNGIKDIVESMPPAVRLALADKREISYTEKLADAIEFLALRKH
jgi:hypothetical protein